MKKIILTVAAVFAFGVASSQVRENGTIELAPHIGYSSYFLNGDEVADLSSITSINFGVHADYFFNNRWSLRSGLLFQTMGAEDFSGELKLNYISIPVNVNWHFGSTRKWYLNFGPSASFLTKAEFSGTDVKDGIESFQLGISYGLGYKLEISEKFSLLIEGQNLFGFSNIYKDSTLTRMNAGGSLNIGGVFKL
jgi:hypothetical protein